MRRRKTTGFSIFLSLKRKGKNAVVSAYRATACNEREREARQQCERELKKEKQVPFPKERFESRNPEQGWIGSRLEKDREEGKDEEEREPGRHRRAKDTERRRVRGTSGTDEDAEALPATKEERKCMRELERGQRRRERKGETVAQIDETKSHDCECRMKRTRNRPYSTAVRQTGGDESEERGENAT